MKKRKFIDLQTIDNLLILGTDVNTKKLICMCLLCNCICLKDYNSVIRNHTKSCGCLRETQLIKHNLKKTSEYKSWECLRYRCNCKTSPDYKNYGGRGIKVCSRWNNFINFYNDMGEKPEPKKNFSIDRINNDKGYSPENCRWVDKKTQARNTRKCHWDDTKIKKAKDLYFVEKKSITFIAIFLHANNKTIKQIIFDK